MINAFLQGQIPNPKARLYIFLVLSVIIGLGLFFLATKLSPWYYAINTPVKLYLDAPANVKVNICWDQKHNQCLPLVPYLTKEKRQGTGSEIADVWMSELPPQPAYSLSVIFRPGVKKVVFHELVLDTSSLLLFGRVPNVGISNLHLGVEKFTTNGMPSSTVNGLAYFDTSQGGKITFPEKVYSGLSNENKLITTIIVWGLLFSIYLLIAIPLYLFPHSIQNISIATKIHSTPKYAKWTYLLFGGAILLMVWLVIGSGILFNEYDPLSYLRLALTGRWFSEARLPGYPFFVDATLWISNYNLSGIILLQAFLFALSIMVCVLTLKKWIPQLIAIAFVLLCLFSPAQVHYARWILRESLFTSLVILLITAMIAHFTSQKTTSNIWLFVFSISCGLAFLVRENGIILPFILLPALIPRAIKLLTSSGTIWERGRSFVSLFSKYLFPFVVVGITYTIFAGYNYLHYGYFQIGIHQTSHSSLVTAIYPGNSDARGLLYQDKAINTESKPYLGWPLYSSYIVARNQLSGQDPVYMSFFPYAAQKMANKNMFYRANILNQIGKNMNNLVPWKANLAGLLRQYTKIISMPLAYSFPALLRNASETASDQTLLSNSFLPVKVKLDESLIGSDNIFAAYFNLTQGYEWYSTILILALIASVYILKNADPAFLAPITAFLGNCFALLFTRLVHQRYIVNLDVLLILQITLAISFWAHKRFSSKNSLAETETSSN